MTKTLVRLIFLILMGGYGQAQMTPELVLQIHSVYEKMNLELPHANLPAVASTTESVAIPASAATAGTVAMPTTAEELEKRLSESESPRSLVGTTPLLIHPLLENSKFFESKETDTEEIKKEMDYLSKLRALLLQNAEGFDAVPFINSCKSAGPYWIEYLMAQQTSDVVREHTMTALLTSPALFSVVLSSPFAQKDPVTLTYWGTHFQLNDPTSWALRLMLVNVQPSLEAAVMKSVLTSTSSVYTKLLNEVPEIATNEDLQEALISLASPNKVRRSHTIQALSKSPKASEVCLQLIESSKEIRIMILNAYPIAKLKEMNTPYSLAAYYRRLGSEATTLNEKIKQFTLAAETTVDGSECLKTILSLPEALEIIQALPPKSTHLGTLFTDLKKEDSAQLQFLNTFLQKQGEKAKEENLNALSAILLAGRNPVLQEMTLAVISTIYTPETAEEIVKITQGKIGVVAEEARQGNASALKALQVMTQDPEVAMRDSAYESLTVLANVDPKARELVISMSKDKSPFIRQLTVIALGSKALRKRELLVILLDSTKDKDPGVRSAACNSLIASALRNNEEATQALASLAENDPVDSVKQIAIRSLASSTTAGNTKAVDSLKKLALNSNPIISNAAKSALSGAPRS